MATRIREYPEDSERIARTIEDRFGSTIRDKSSFSDAFVQYMGVDGDPLIKKRGFENDTFDAFVANRKRRKKKIDEGSIIEEAGGKDLRKDRAKTADTVVKTREEYDKKGAANVDLEGYDTRKEFIKTGIIRGKIIRVRETQFKIKGKSVKRLRDNLGRFAKRR